MGISDDIRPKKYKPIASKSVKTEIKVAREKIAKTDNKELFQQSHDGDFFADTPIGNKDKSQKKSEHQNPHPQKNHSAVFTLIILLVVFILIGLVVWQNYPTIKGYADGSYKTKNSQNLTDIINQNNDSVKNYTSSNQSAPASTTTSDSQPAATVPVVDKSTIVVSVLNGCGVKSAATTVSTILKDAGFTVKSTGNARSFGYTKTYIYYKTDDATTANLIKDALPTYQTEVVKNASVVGASYDIVVVVGKT